MTRRRLAALTIAALAGICCAACGSSFPIQPALPTSIVVTGLSPAIGGRSQLTVITTLSDNSTEDVTSKSKFQVANPTFATVSASGVVTGVAPGSTIVTATFQTFNAGVTITVH
jgi:hypothetical protein